LNLVEIFEAMVIDRLMMILNSDNLVNEEERAFRKFGLGCCAEEINMICRLLQNGPAYEVSIRTLEFCSSLRRLESETEFCHQLK